MSSIIPISSGRLAGKSPSTPSRRAGHALALSMAAGFAILPLSALASEVNDVDGVAIKGQDPVAYFRQGKPVDGSAEFTAVYKGATFRFASAANRDAFRAKPEAFAPQYGGFCAFGTSRGYKADIDPQAFTIVDNKLYLNYSKKVQAEWKQDIPGYIAKADGNWPTVVKTDKVYR
jgi:YHS domain-containing protein